MNTFISPKSAALILLRLQCYTRHKIRNIRNKKKEKKPTQMSVGFSGKSQKLKIFGRVHVPAYCTHLVLADTSSMRFQNALCLAIELSERLRYRTSSIDDAVPSIATTPADCY